MTPKKLKFDPVLFVRIVFTMRPYGIFVHIPNQNSLKGENNYITHCAICAIAVGTPRPASGYFALQLQSQALSLIF